MNTDPAPDAAKVEESALELDTFKVPLEAPVGTPTPLKEAYTDIADALFQAAGFRRECPNCLSAFEDFARPLSGAYRKATNSYAAAESVLLRVADETLRYAHKNALDVVCAVNAAVGTVILHNGPLQRRSKDDFPDGLIHIKQAAAIVREVPAFDATALLKAVREQTCLAKERLMLTAVKAADSAGDRPEVDTITWHSDRVYSIAGKLPVEVTPPEHAVLQPFLTTPAMGQSQLIGKSKIEHAHKILAGLETRYEGIFAPAIRRPGKGGGGYQVKIRAAKPRPE